MYNPTEWADRVEASNLLSPAKKLELEDRLAGWLLDDEPELDPKVTDASDWDL